MKRFFMGLVIAAFVAVTAGTAKADVEIRDMNRGHWAYKSVQYLVDKGYLALYQDNTFRGAEPVTREVFAVALMKLIDQIKSGEIKAGAMDIQEIKKLSDSFKSEISDYETRAEALEKRLKDLEADTSISSRELTKAMSEYRDGFDKMTEENEKMRRDMGIMNDELKTINGSLEKERKDRKSAQTMTWVGILIAAAVGAASN